MGHPLKEFGKLSMFRQFALRDEILVVDDNDMYRGTGGAGVAFDPTLGTILGTGTAGAGVPGFGVHNRQSLILTGDNFSTNGSAVAYDFIIVGYDLDGVLQTETINLSVIATPVSKASIHVYSRVVSITVGTLTLGSGVADATPLLAVGHGACTIAGAAGITRLPRRPGANTAGHFLSLVDPNGAQIPITLGTLTTGPKALLHNSGTTLPVGTWVVHYNPEYIESLQ